MTRGIERKAIFQDDKDSDALLDQLGGILIESSIPCYEGIGGAGARPEEVWAVG